MSEPGELFLLDTSIVVHYLRDDHVARKVEQQFNLRHRSERPLVCVVTVGELLAIARKFAWGERKQMLLLELLGELVVVDINSGPVLESYAELSHATERIGKKMGQQNDIWIAATTKATGAHLITADRDFDVLHPDHIQRTWVDQHI